MSARGTTHSLLMQPLESRTLLSGMPPRMLLNCSCSVLKMVSLLQYRKQTRGICLSIGLNGKAEILRARAREIIDVWEKRVRTTIDLKLVISQQGGKREYVLPGNKKYIGGAYGAVPQIG